MSEQAKELRRLVEVNKLVKYPGYKEFLEKISDSYTYVQGKIDSLTKTMVSSENLEKLNYHIAERNALGSLLIADEELKEELEEALENSSSPSDDVKQFGAPKV